MTFCGHTGRMREMCVLAIMLTRERRARIAFKSLLIPPHSGRALRQTIKGLGTYRRRNESLILELWFTRAICIHSCAWDESKEKEEKKAAGGVGLLYEAEPSWTRCL